METLSLGNTAELMTLNMEAINANGEFSKLLEYIVTSPEFKQMSDKALLALNLEILNLIDDVEKKHLDSLKIAIEQADALALARDSRNFFVKQLSDIKNIYTKYSIALPN